jgi:hypothetical protein
MLCTLAVPPNLSYAETSIVAVPEGLALSTATYAASRTLAMFNGLARRPATLGSLGGSVTGECNGYPWRHGWNSRVDGSVRREEGSMAAEGA